MQCVIPCPHQPPTRNVNRVLVALSGTATPSTTKQLLPPDRVYIYIYIYVCARPTSIYIYIYIYMYY